MGAEGATIGEVLDGKYRVERVLGRGGMGIVVQATHLQLHQAVAMKFLRPEVLGNEQIAQRFLREARAAACIKSEHVARVIDVCTLGTGEPYIVLEYLEGTDLASAPRAHWTIGGVVDLVLQACEALAEAHALGIVHRDVKPANLFLTRGADGAWLVKVLDFGISKTRATMGELTSTQDMIGTPVYMSPEQLRSPRDVDHRSDIWSLGVVLYELLQGVPPFGGTTFSAVALGIVSEPVPKLAVRLPGELDGVVYRCLEKDPAKRFQSVAELVRALARYAQSETQAAISVKRTSGIAGIEPAPLTAEMSAARRGPSTPSGPPSAHSVVQRPGRRWPAFALVGVATAMVLATIVIASRGRGAGSQPSLAPASSSPAVLAPAPAVVAPAPAVVAPAPAVVAPSPTPPPSPPPTKKSRRSAKAAASPTRPARPTASQDESDADVLEPRQ